MIPLDRSEVLRLGYYRQSGGGYTGGIHSREVGGLANPPESQASMSNLDSYKNEHYHPCEYIKIWWPYLWPSISVIHGDTKYDSSIYVVFSVKVSLWRAPTPFATSVISLCHFWYMALEPVIFLSQV